MRVNNNPISLLCTFVLCSSLAVSICRAEEKTLFEVVGSGECADCKENNFEPSLAYSGLGVTIDCKLKNGELKRIGAGELDKEGNFKVSVPRESIKDECYAQLHSAAQIPCPAHDGLEAHKIEPKAHSNGKQAFGPARKIQFSTALCTSEFLWPHHFKHHPLFTKKKFPPLKGFGHPLLHHKPLLPPPVPIYKPKPKPFHHPPVPVYKPKPNPPVIVKPLPPPVPIYKPPVIVKPLPPPVPIYKPPVPIYKPPVIVKPFPPPVPIYKPPVIVKKPCPPLPKLPPLPKIPPKHFHHPKFGHWPPLPPTIPHP